MLLPNLSDELKHWFEDQLHDDRGEECDQHEHENGNADFDASADAKELFRNEHRDENKARRPEELRRANGENEARWDWNRRAQAGEELRECWYSMTERESARDYVAAGDNRDSPGKDLGLTTFVHWNFGSAASGPHEAAAEHQHATAGEARMRRASGRRRAGC